MGISYNNYQESSRLAGHLCLLLPTPDPLTGIPRPGFEVGCNTVAVCAAACGFDPEELRGLPALWFVGRNLDSGGELRERIRGWTGLPG